MWTFLVILCVCQTLMPIRFIECTHVVGGIFQQTASVERAALENSLERASIEEITPKPAIAVPYALNSLSVSKAGCTIENPIAVFGPQVPAVDGALRERTAEAHIPHLQATWQPPEPDIDPEQDGCYNVEDPCSDDAVENDSRCCFVSLNLYPDAEELSQAMAHVLLEYGWSTFTILYEDDFGLMRIQKMLSTFISLPGVRRMPIVIRKLEPGEDNQAIFKELDEMHESRVLLDCHVDNVMGYFENAAKSHMLNDYQSYILTSLEAHSISQQLVDMTQLRANVSWLSMFKIEDRRLPNDPLKDQAKSWNSLPFTTVFDSTIVRLEQILVADAVTHLSVGMNLLTDDIQNENNAPPSVCLNDKEPPWKLGPKLQSTLMNNQSNGFSGNIEFDRRGKRVNYSLYLHQMLNGDNPNTLMTWESSTGIFNASTRQETDAAALSANQAKKFIVMSKITQPYFWNKTAAKGEVLEGNDRYEGFSVDLITEIFRIMNNQSMRTYYSFEFVEPTPEQNTQGKYDANRKQWTGLIGELLNKKADLIICDLTITEERKSVVDFSVPFMTLGISILFTKDVRKQPGTFSFLTPYSVEVWIFTATAYLVVSIVLFVASRISPGDWENPQPCDPDPEELENIWNFKNCTWLTMGSIMTQGCDILPKAFASRWVCGMWWFFAMIVCQTYIAQLAASLTSALEDEPIKDVADLANRGPTMSYGCMESGSTAQFFARSKDKMFEKMWLRMNTSRPSLLCRDNEEGAHRVLQSRAVQGKNKYAFFMESITIEYLAKRNCDLTQVGNLLDSKDYGIAMPANSPFRTKINTAILNMQQSGLLNEIKTKWWETKYDAKNCSEGIEKGDVEGDLEMSNLIGAFLVLGVGCFFSVVIAAFEFLDHIRNIVKVERMTHREAFVMELKSSLNLTKQQKPVRGLASRSPSAEPAPAPAADSGLKPPRPMHAAAASFIDFEKMF